MANIKYICLSDLHFGQDNSLLTCLKEDSPERDYLNASPVLINLVNALRHLVTKINTDGTKPILILNGDILELALAEMNEAAMQFERFIDLILPEKIEEQLFSEIIYVPGNHDHHFWEIARETQYVDHIKDIPCDQCYEPPYHTSDLFDSDLTCYFLTKLIQRREHLKQQNYKIKIAYPNYGIINDDKSKCIIFHHGHFIEDIYKLMTSLMDMMFPERLEDKTEDSKKVWKLEAENFAWIDFFWSTMGRSGDAGKKVEVIYESFQNKESRERIVSNLAKGFSKRYGLSGRIGDFIEETILNSVIDILFKMASNREKTITSDVLTQKAEEYLLKFLETQVYHQLIDDIKTIPDQVTFVYGHTHKPDHRKVKLNNYPQIVNVYNTGGWVAEKVPYDPVNGASIALIDEQLNTVLLNIYNEDDNRHSQLYKPQVVCLEENKPEPLYSNVNNNTKNLPAVWYDLSESIKEELQIRKDNLPKDIKEKRKQKT